MKAGASVPSEVSGLYPMYSRYYSRREKSEAPPVSGRRKRKAELPLAFALQITLMAKWAYFGFTCHQAGGLFAIALGLQKTTAAMRLECAPGS